NVADDVGPRQDEHVHVALQIARVIREPLAAEIGVGQLSPLDHRPHCAIEDENALCEQLPQRVSKIGVHRDASCLRVFVAVSVFVPPAISTVNGSPALRAPTPTFTSFKPHATSMRSSSASSKPRRRSP